MQRTARETQNKLPIVQGEEIDSDQAYHGDIYGKGAFFMHTLRYIIGDEIFFPTLKRLATEPQYIYENTVTTNDVEKLFSTAYGKSLKPLFDLYLRTTNKLEISLRQTGEDTYKVQLVNLDYEIPIDVVTSTGKQKIVISKTPVTITSTSLPMLDQDVYYLKKVIVE